MHSIIAAAVPAAVATKRPRVPPKATTFAIVGNGWRSSVFIRMAYLMPERFELVGVVARREAGAGAAARTRLGR